MRALRILGIVLCLSGCIHAGELNFWPERSGWIAGLSSYPIEYMASAKERLLGSETMHESNFKANKLLTAYKGFTVVDTKSYDKNYYVQESIIAPSNAMLSSGVSPSFIEGGKKYEVFGRTHIDGQTYYLIASDSPTTVFLVDENYTLQKHIGTVRDDKLVLLSDTFTVTPEGFQFEPVTKSRVLQSDMVDGFEIKFNGVKNNIMTFTLMQYDAGGATGEFHTYNFENKPGIIQIAGIEIKIFGADDLRVEYMILAEAANK
ncbi:MAG: hypothetical protein Q4D11_03755 [Rhodospirillales bacterium]|nr:hypothetical protein [Rhodospirillales bacterium]